MAHAETEPDPWVIREAVAEDCHTLTDLMLRSSAYQGRYQAIVADYPVTRAMVERGGIFVAERAGKAVGFYRLDFANADLDLMFVADEVQGMGIGQALLDHMRSFAASQGLPTVTIVAHPPAADFYRRMGAVDTGISKSKRGNGWDRAILKIATLS